MSPRNAGRHNVGGKPSSSHFLCSFLRNDVIIQVFQHLGPYDLLRLARTTKGLRRFLFSPTTAPLWRSCRANVPDLPDCPQDLSEPQYAYLMFELICHVSLSPDAYLPNPNNKNRQVLWNKECCQRCGPSTYTMLSEMRFGEVPDTI